MIKYLWLILFFVFSTSLLSRTIYDKPFFFADTLYLSVPDTLMLCGSTKDTLEINAISEPDNLPISWSPSAGLTILDNGRKILASPTVSTLYTASINTPSGVFTASVWVRVDRLPSNFSLQPADTLICQGQSAQISTSGFSPLDFPNLQFNWSGNGLLSDKKNEFGLFKPDVSAIVYCDITNGVCTLKNADSASIRVISIEIACDPDTNKIEIGTSLTLTAVLSPNQINATDFAFNWFEAATAAGTGLSFSPKTNRNFDEDSVRIKFRVVANGLGCELGTEKNIFFFNPKIVIPNAFTPNGDGMNDTFGMKVIRGTTTQLSIQIFNRWGEIVFESSEKNARWNGKNLNDSEVPSDVYFYVIQWQRGDGALQPIERGEVTLLR